MPDPAPLPAPPQPAEPQPPPPTPRRIDIGQVARAVSAVEDRRPEAQALLRDAHAMPRVAPVVGVTGPPGAGKSTLLDALALHWADAGLRVALLLVDPASPFTGGALLGDRCRVDRAAGHANVFVRSLSSRGQVGGLSRAAHDVTLLLGALGFDLVLVETVGSGQSDVEVAALADCVVVVSVAGLGDQVQAAKAGLLEIADVHVVNKSDAPGADAVVAHLRGNLDLVYAGREGVNPPDTWPGASAMQATNDGLRARHESGAAGTPSWRPPVLPASARDGAGTADIARAVDAFLAWQRGTGHDLGRRAERLRSEVLRLAADHLQEALARQPQLPALLEAVRAGRSTPEAAAGELVAALRRGCAGA